MPATIVVGGQFGSEGKGKVVALMAAKRRQPWVVRCGGPNSGHTCNVDGKDCVLRQLPSAAGHPNAKLLLSAGCVIDEEVLVGEIEDHRIDGDRVFVDERAILVEEADRLAEHGIADSIGSTGSGTGAAIARRVLRGADVRLAGSSSRLGRLVNICKVAPQLHRELERGAEVIVEGTQGFGLSLLHGEPYPFVTSRDTTASGFASEVGLSPRQVNEIVMVIRTFPIRVGGNSGPLDDEFSWEEIRRSSDAPHLEEEFTSVTQKLRRVARFDLELVRLASTYNRPTSLAVMGVDRLDYRNRGLKSLRDFTPVATDFLTMLRTELGVPISLVGTGFGTTDAISTEGEFVGEVKDAC